MCRYTLTFLFHKPKAMAALTAIVDLWGGSIAERMQRRADAWRPSRPPEKPEETPKAAALTQNPRKPPTRT
jgi:hypothetical protein